MEYSPANFPKTFDASRLKNKSILITGGASGLGAAFARKFAAAGAFVTIADVNRDMGAALEAELTKANLGAKFVYCDVTSWKSQTEAFKTAISSSPTKTLDTVIAGAGVTGSGFDMTPQSANPTNTSDPPEPATSCIKINLIGIYYTTQLGIYYMGSSQTASGNTAADPFSKTQNGTSSQKHEKSIVMVGSLAGYLAIIGVLEYTAAKYGVRGILKALSPDMHGVGLRLNLIAPTYVKTPLLNKEAVEGLTAAGVQFAEVETAVDAVGVLATDVRIHGRAILVGADGNLDLRDDDEGLNGGLTLQAYSNDMEERRVKLGLGGKGSERFFYL